MVQIKNGFKSTFSESSKLTRTIFMVQKLHIVRHKKLYRSHKKPFWQFRLKKQGFFAYWVVNFPQDWTQWVRESPAVPHSWRKLFSFLKLCYYACVIDTPINIKHIAPHNGFNVILNSHLNNFISQNSQQKSVSDLYVLTVAFLALKKLVFSLFRTQKKISKIFFIKLLCNFSVRTL